jgi:hypothetical protein
MKTLKVTLLVAIFELTFFQLNSQISVIGIATPASEWNTDFNMIQDPQNNDQWTITLQLFADEIKFRQDGNWTVNWGGSFPGGTAIPQGPNIAVTQPGNYLITFNTSSLEFNFTLLPLGGVGIGTNTPNQSAILDLVSTSKGLLIPRMTTSQMLGIQNPAPGLMVFDTQANALCAYSGGQWQVINGLPSGNINDLLFMGEAGPIWKPLFGQNLIPGPDFNGSSSLPAGPVPTGFVIENNRGYIVDRQSQDIKVVDISNPESPNLLGSKKLWGSPTAVAAGGNHVLVTDDDLNNVKILDVSDPGNIVLLDSLTVGDTPSAIVIKENYALITDRTSDDLKVIDFTDPNNLILAYNSPVTLSNPLQMFKDGDLIYINNVGSIHVFNIANPELPVLVKATNIGGGGSVRISNIVNGIMQVSVFGANDFVKWYDVSDPMNITLLSQKSIGTFPLANVINENFGIVQNNGDGNLGYLYDIKDPSNPILIDSIGFSSIGQMVIEGNYLMIASANFFSTVKLSVPQPIGLDANGNIAKVTPALDGDSDPQNELITSAILNGSNLEISDAGGVKIIDLTPISSSGSSWSNNGNNIYNSNIGSVGIGTDGPLAKLSVIGNIHASNQTGESEYISIGHDGNNGFINKEGDGFLNIKSDGTTRFSISSDDIIINGSSATSIADITLLGDDALIRMGPGATGPHGFAFGDNGTEGLQLLYRSASNKLIVEKGNDFLDQLDLFSIDYDDHKTFIRGSVGIGTETQANGYMLSVNGKIISTELRVENIGSWPDYVFKPDYPLLPLRDLEKEILKNGHLPNIPSAETIEKEGILVGDMQKRIMEKIEELTLYLIAQEKEIIKLKEEISTLKSQKK